MVKIFVVGDSGVGKTCLVTVFAEQKFPYYLPTLFEDYSRELVIDNIREDVILWDAGGLADQKHLRTMAYTDADIVLFCCSVDLPESLLNIKHKWIPEAKPLLSENARVVLVVNKVDLRHDESTIQNLDLADSQPLLKEQCLRFGQEIGAVAVFECSAKRMAGVNLLFGKIVRISRGKKIQQHKEKGCIIC